MKLGYGNDSTVIGRSSTGPEQLGEAHVVLIETTF